MSRRRIAVDRLVTLQMGDVAVRRSSFRCHGIGTNP